MPTGNITRNRKRFIKNILDRRNNEKIVIGSVDGEASIIPQYRRYFEEEKRKNPTEYHMTLFPTNMRIVVYQTNGFLTRDKYAQLPLSEIDEITYREVHRKGKLICIAEFIAPDDSRYPSIVFKMDSSGYQDDAKQFQTILKGISGMSGIRIHNYMERAHEPERKARNRSTHDRRQSNGRARKQEDRMRTRASEHGASREQRNDERRQSRSSVSAHESYETGARRQRRSRRAR